MARIRKIYPEYLFSESLSRVCLEAEMFFPRLWLAADDAGRVRGEATVLAAQVFPRRKGLEAMVTFWLDEYVPLPGLNTGVATFMT